MGEPGLPLTTGEGAPRMCGECAGLGLTDERDEWGFGKPCPKCNGTGELAAVEDLIGDPNFDPPGGGVW